MALSDLKTCFGVLRSRFDVLRSRTSLFYNSYFNASSYVFVAVFCVRLKRVFNYMSRTVACVFVLRLTSGLPDYRICMGNHI